VPVTTGIVLVGGTIVGSAAGAALHRWPSGGSLRRPARSSCDGCGVLLRPRDLVPIASWIVLRGRCASCDHPIDVRLPILEALSGLVAVGAFRAHGAGWLAILLAVGGVGVLLATFTDMAEMRIPDRLTLPLAVASVLGVMAVDPDPRRIAAVLLWALGVPGVLLLLSAALVRHGRPRPLGGGDVKLLIGVLALLCAIPGGPVAGMAAAVVSGGAVATVGLVTGRLHRGDRIPFAPFIANGYLLTVLFPEFADVIARNMAVAFSGGAL